MQARITMGDMQVEEIHFNHNPASVSGDAMTIRLNNTDGPFVAPEWQRSPAKRDPAAYVRDAQSQPTIKARFSGGPANGTVLLRAVDANAPSAQPNPGCLGFVIWLVQKFVNKFFGTIGEVAATSVTFDESGRSGLVTMNLNSPWLGPNGFVSKRHTVWQWQRRNKGVWTDFDVTEHTIYVVLDTPGAPWVQAGDATQLPWTYALDTACSWAVGAKTKDEVAAKITERVNRLPAASYIPSTMFGYDDFQFQSFLETLGSGGEFKMNCTDCADAVTTLSNLLGCNLGEGQFYIMHTRPFLTLSGDAASAADWVQWDWSYHEICWLGSQASNTVWDGCLQLDLSDVAGTYVAMLPVRMAFDAVIPAAYKPRLIETGPGTLEGLVRHRKVV